MTTTQTPGASVQAAATAPDNDSIAVDGRSAMVRLLNGTSGHKYKITNRIVTDESPTQTDDRSFYLKVKER